MASNSCAWQVGALIGKGGSVIKNIRQTSGAMVKISSVGESNDVSCQLACAVLIIPPYCYLTQMILVSEKLFVS